MMDLAKVIPSQIGRTRLTLNTFPESVVVTFHYPHTAVTSTLKLPRYFDEKLFLLGVALYAGEGTKAFVRRVGASKRSSEAREVEFVNGNPEIITCFLDFLESLGFDRKRCRARLKTTREELEENTNFWSTVTGIPRENFSSPRIRRIRDSSRLSEHGTLTVRLFCKPLWRILRYWSTHLHLLY